MTILSLSKQLTHKLFDRHIFVAERFDQYLFAYSSKATNICKPVDKSMPEIVPKNLERLFYVECLELNVEELFDFIKLKFLSFSNFN